MNDITRMTRVGLEDEIARLRRALMAIVVRGSKQVSPNIWHVSDEADIAKQVLEGHPIPSSSTEKPEASEPYVDPYAELRTALGEFGPYPPQWFAEQVTDEETDEHGIPTWRIINWDNTGGHPSSNYEGILAELWSAEHDNEKCAKYIAAASPALIARLLKELTKGK